MTRAELERTLRRLREAGKLTFVRGRWCRQEAPDDSREVMSYREGRELYLAGVAQLVSRQLEPTGRDLP